MPRPCSSFTRAESTDYLERFTASLDSAITSGFLLAADRAEILAPRRRDVRSLGR